MTGAEKAKLGNGIYAAVLEVLGPYEARGFNSHHAAQRMINLVTAECEYWIEMNQMMQTDLVKAKAEPKTTYLNRMDREQKCIHGIHMALSCAQCSVSSCSCETDDPLRGNP